MSASASSENTIVQLSSTKFIIGCAIVALSTLFLGSFYSFPPSLLAAEVFLTVISLFVLGSAKYRLDKNAITYGASLIIMTTFWSIWWPTSELKIKVASEGYGPLFSKLAHLLFTLEGLDHLFHADTMLFILGLTFFVAVIAQTRLLETISFSVLRRNKGMVVPTIAILAAVVSFSSGILDGVSMIGLMIRILVMILFLARAKDSAIIYAIMVSTIVTTVCGMWLAYGEPPNLIMKSNLHPHLDNAFFLRYCLPVAIGSYLIVTFNIRKRLKGKKVDTSQLDILDLQTADVRFLQASRHGEVPTPTEFVDRYHSELGSLYENVEKRLHQGEPLGLALVHESVPVEIRRSLMGKYLVENLAEDLDEHYQHEAKDDHEKSRESAKKIEKTLKAMGQKRKYAQKIGGLAFIPFIGLLIWHAIDHDVPLFFASFAGFLVAVLGIFSIKKMRKLAFHEARHEFSEYLFLLPLFLSITLLQKTDFFGIIKDFLDYGIAKWGVAHLAYAQFTGATFLSAILDNNVVADFLGRMIKGLEIGTLHLFAMAQIAGYAAGGCWTHIGSAQSVVAYAFIQRQVDDKFTPFQWMKAMTPVILEIFVLMTVVVYGEAFLMHYLER